MLLLFTYFAGAKEPAYKVTFFTTNAINNGDSCGISTDFLLLTCVTAFLDSGVDLLRFAQDILNTPDFYGQQNCETTGIGDLFQCFLQ